MYSDEQNICSIYVLLTVRDIIITFIPNLDMYIHTDKKKIVLSPLGKNSMCTLYMRLLEPVRHI